MDRLIAEFHARGGVVTVVPQGVITEVVWKRGWAGSAAHTRNLKELHWIRSDAAARRRNQTHTHFVTPVDVHFKQTE